MSDSTESQNSAYLASEEAVTMTVPGECRVLDVCCILARAQRSARSTLDRGDKVVTEHDV